MGEIRPWNAEGREGLDDVQYFDVRVGGTGGRADERLADEVLAAVREYLHAKREERRAKQLRGRPPTGVMQAFAAGPDWSQPQEVRDAFARETIQWFQRQLGPNSRVALCAAHNDESFHLHLAFVCVDDHGNLGWMKVRDRLADLPIKEFPDPGKLSQKE